MADWQRRQSKDSRHRLLLPLSYGVSSSVLLHALNAYIERQHSKPHNPTVYELHVLVIEPSTVSPLVASDGQNFVSAQRSFPMHSYTQIPLHSIFEYDPEVREVMTQFAGPCFVDDASLSDRERLDAFRASISTATSKTDVDNILMSRLVVACAKKFGCRAVLWGDSDSRLAAKSLANVAKGRGSSLTWQVSDGLSPWGVEFKFLLRDLFKAELHDYAKLVPELEGIIVPDVPLSDNILTKNLSIDELMMRYVETQGEKYPGVMANVARTVTKLKPAPFSTDAYQCTFCGAFTGNLDGKSSCVTDADTLEDDRFSQFCYGCARSRPEPVN